MGKWPVGVFSSYGLIPAPVISYACGSSAMGYFSSAFLPLSPVFVPGVTNHFSLLKNSEW